MERRTQTKRNVKAAIWFLTLGLGILPGHGLTAADIGVEEISSNPESHGNEGDVAARLEAIKDRMRRMPRQSRKDEWSQWIEALDADITSFQKDFPGADQEPELLYQLCLRYTWHFQRTMSQGVFSGYLIPSSDGGTTAGYARAVERAEEFLKKFPDHEKRGRMRLVRGMSLLSLDGRRKEGRKALESLGENGSVPDRIHALMHLTDHWRKQERYDKAREFLKSAVDAAPSPRSANVISRNFPYLDWLGKRLDVLTVEDIKGNRFSSEREKGNVLMVYFGYAGRGPVPRNNPGLLPGADPVQTLYEKYREKGFRVLGIGIAYAPVDPKDVQDFTRHSKFSFPICYDGTVAQSEMVQRYNRDGLVPSGFLVDRKGIVRYAMMQELVFSGNRVISMDEAVRTLLEEPDVPGKPLEKVEDEE